jgi:hypothetical protein
MLFSRATAAGDLRFVALDRYFEEKPEVMTLHLFTN